MAIADCSASTSGAGAQQNERKGQSADIVELARYRASRQPVIQHNLTTRTPEHIAPTLAGCRSLLYIGTTPDGYMNYGLSRVEYDDALHMIKAAGYLIGELSKIIGEDDL